MANIKSAEKRNRQATKKRSRNRTRVSRLRTAVKKYGQLDSKKKAEAVPDRKSVV